MAAVLLSEDLRTMTIPRTEKIIGCVGDKNVRSVYFQMPRYCDDTDLSEYRLQVHYINAEGNGNYYDVLDRIVTETNISFTWLVDALACAKDGIVQVNIILTHKEGNSLKNEYNSGIGKFKVKPAFHSGPYGPAAVDAYGNYIVFKVLKE